MVKVDSSVGPALLDVDGEIGTRSVQPRPPAGEKPTEPILLLCRNATLVVTGATLVVTGALLVVTRSTNGDDDLMQHAVKHVKHNVYEDVMETSLLRM